MVVATSQQQNALFIWPLDLALRLLRFKPRPNPLLNVLALVGGSLVAWSGYNEHCTVKAALVDGSGGHQRLGRGAV
jgi:hypothetical protein